MASLAEAAIASAPGVTDEQLEELEKAVWVNQREHVRLLRLREGQKARTKLSTLEEQRKLEADAQAASAATEAELDAQIRDRRVDVQSLKAEFSETCLRLVKLEEDQEKALADDRRVAAELAEQTEILQKEFDELAEMERMWAEQQETLTEATNRRKALEAELAEEHEKNAGIDAELQAALVELRGWERDRERAAALTAKAQELLGH
mmetsp:Transcript_44054/g.113933  ORF Transcript_44054/g.113933 Transcript_44054/m.113933 type:complete len:207 (-) Transcript_44054:68-688(-)